MVGVQGNATHIYLGTEIYDDFSGHRTMGDFGLYHLSKEVLAGHDPYLSWIENKHFKYSEELAKTIAIYQQVCGK